MQRSTFFVGILVLFYLLIYCNQSKPNIVSHNSYRNLDPKAKYVGTEACIGCHANIYETYKNTGMGLSFADATLEKSAADFRNYNVVYDSLTNFFYHPYFKEDSFFIKEFRILDTDTIFQRIQYIDYIIGSGQHTNSHLFQENGYLYQAPITYYTQRKLWDLAPGYKAKNERFERVLTAECITCHNHFPEKIEGSIHKFNNMPQGIGCERCHGPGSIHIEEKMNGIIVDTSAQIDYSIVNPADLPIEYQLDLCQRCHLQGVSVLKPGKTYYDFRPGMRLNTVMDVYLPRFSDTHEKFIMASQADRLRMSKCFQVSTNMSCLTCHNPHISIKDTPSENFNKVCNNCHGAETHSCSENLNILIENERNCIKCHMPKSGSKDIPHVNITDHNISIRSSEQDKDSYVSEADKKDIAEFLGLEKRTGERTTALDMARGYLATYSKYIPEKIMLDSAEYYLKKNSDNSVLIKETWIEYYFLRQNFESLINYVSDTTFINSYDGWTNYRVGEAFMVLGDNSKALHYFNKAVNAMPLQLDFIEKLGIVQLNMELVDDAIESFLFVLAENPKRPLSLNNLGYCLALKGQLSKAEQYYDQALELNPDYTRALINKSALYAYKGDLPMTRELLKRVLKIDPQNTAATNILNEIQAE